MKRRLLSLFMAMVMVLSLAPAALASSGAANAKKIEFASDTVKTLKVGGTATLSAEIKDSTVLVTGVTLNKSSIELTLPKTESQTVSETLTATVQPDNATNKEVTWSSGDSSVATVSNGTVTALKAGEATITVTTVDGSKRAQCTVKVKAAENPPEGDGKDDNDEGSDDSDVNNPGGTGGEANQGPQTTSRSVLSNSSSDGITFTSNNTDVITVSGNTITAVGVGSAKITASATGADSAEINVTVANPIKVSRTSGSGSTLHIGDTMDLTAALDFATGVNPSAIEWSTDDAYVADVNQSGRVIAYGAGTAKISAKVTYDGKTYQDAFTVTVSSDYSVSVSVAVDSAGYALGDTDDKGGKSIIDQIGNKLPSTRYIENIWFDEITDKYGDLDATRSNSSHGSSYSYSEDDAADVVFTPDSSAKKGDVANFNITVEDTKGSTYTFELSFTLIEGTGASSGDIIYTASLGEDVPFEVSDFEDFYTDKYSRGSLEYVTFGSSSSNGTLYNEDDKSAGSTSYYVDPSSRQKGLDGIYFSPKSSMKKSTTVKITFTAYGTTRSNSGAGEVEGTVSIIYLNDSASDITYSTTNGKVTLDPKDFENAYKEATGSKTAPSGLTIEFQNVPTNGTLTYTGGSKDKDLTKSTVKSNRYTTKSSGSYRLAQLTYSGTKGKDTIDYIAYSGGTAQFSGKVVFNGAPAVPTDVVVGPFYSTAGQPAAFSQNTFTAASSAMSNAVKVRFVAPANGTLTMSGASAAGTDIAVSLLNLVSYQPKAGYNGTDQIIFAAYDAKNAVVASGTVNVQVIGNPTTTTPTTPGGSTGGVTDVSQFKDVASGAWYRDNLATLVKKGVISGKGEGKFDPKGTVTYGEALKMVLQACGYSAVAGTGSQWAINYKNLAVSRGWISNDIDLNAAISRNATAELAAKVLGVSPVTSGSPFADEANAYAVALYYTTPQIFVGTTNPNGGKPLFENNKPLLREQVCAVICRVMDYHTQHTTNTMPDGT